jgi:hypothetical protein
MAGERAVSPGKNRSSMEIFGTMACCMGEDALSFNEAIVNDEEEHGKHISGELIVPLYASRPSCCAANGDKVVLVFGLALWPICEEDTTSKQPIPLF